MCCTRNLNLIFRNKMIMKKNIMMIVLVMSISSFTFAQKMGTPILIKAGDKLIDDKIPYAGPTIYDLDKDGLNDLIVGTFKGKFKVYKNTGTKAEPKYDGFEYLQAGGKDALMKNW